MKRRGVMIKKNLLIQSLLTGMICVSFSLFAQEEIQTEEITSTEYVSTVPGTAFFWNSWGSRFIQSMPILELIHQTGLAWVFNRPTELSPM